MSALETGVRVAVEAFAFVWPKIDAAIKRGATQEGLVAAMGAAIDTVELVSIARAERRTGPVGARSVIAIHLSDVADEVSALGLEGQADASILRTIAQKYRRPV